MAGQIRRYTFDPGLEVITAVEGVVIIDGEPASVINGVGSGTTIVVGEFEDGGFSPAEVMSGGDLLNTYGGFGFSYDGTVSNNPCARARKSDSAITPEYWNGNGFIALVNKRFSRLICVRVDTSVGQVQLRRLAEVVGGGGFSFGLTSGQVLSFDIGAGGVDATFTGVPAARDSGTGAYPTTFLGNESFNVTIDEGTDQQIGPVDVVFQSTDQTQAAVISRINQFLGFTCASAVSGTVLKMKGRLGGLLGNVKINSVSSALVTSATGITPGVTNGTGNVQNIAQVKDTEVASIVASATANTVKVYRGADGMLHAYNLNSTPGQSITVHANTTAKALGFAVGATATNSIGTEGFIPAGTRVRTSGGVEWVTMQTFAVTADNQGPYNVKVRPADDDGATAGAAAGAVNVMPYQPLLGAFAVSNQMPLTAALTEPQIDVKYGEALDKTLSNNSVSREGNIIFSARQSNFVRSRLKQNALDASKNGLLGREAVVRPPLKTLRSVAKSKTAQPGVGAYRDERVVYAYPGASTQVPQIAARGLEGGAGFTADGVIDVGYDSWVASTMSQLPPEENPGQTTPFQELILGLEQGNPDVQDMRTEDYIAFRASGIAALIMEDGTATIQSGVTSVDPGLHPGLRNIARRRMADFIQDSLARRYRAFGKKLNTRNRRTVLVGETDGFLTTLVSKKNESKQRIDGYKIDAKSANTADTIALGVYRIITKVRTLSSLDFIVLQTEIGEAVTVTELPNAA